MQRRNFIRAILFVVFFGIGAAALSVSILCDDLVQYYRNRQLLREAHVSLERLKSLNTDYNILLERLEKDPNLIKRIARATFGAEPEDPNTVYPRATAELLAAARRILAEGPNQPSAVEARHSRSAALTGEPSVLPDWLSRCREPRARVTLFFSGVALILISFMCFGPEKSKIKMQKSE